MTHKPIFTPVDPITKLFTGPGVMDALTFEFAGNDGTDGADAVIPDRLSISGINNTIDTAIAAGTAAPAKLLQVGDSLTENWGNNSNNIELVTAFGAGNVLSTGKGGQTSDQIAARQGGTPALATISGGVIPASGSVGITVNVQMFYMNAATGTWSQTANLGGVDGTVTLDKTSGGVYTYTFARTAAGVAIAAPTPLPLITGQVDRRRVMIICIGRNNFKINTPAEIVAHIKSVIEWSLRPANDHIVLTIPASTTETPGTADRISLDATNAAIKAAFPRNVVDAPAYLRSTLTLSQAGITPTATDTQNIADGITPESFRGAGDPLHYNALAYDMLNTLILRTLSTRGLVTWVEPVAPPAPVLHSYGLTDATHRYASITLAPAVGSLSTPWNDSVGTLNLALASTTLVVGTGPGGVDKAVNTPNTSAASNTQRIYNTTGDNTVSTVAVLYNNRTPALIAQDLVSIGSGFLKIGRGANGYIFAQATGTGTVQAASSNVAGWRVGFAWYNSATNELGIDTGGTEVVTTSVRGTAAGNTLAIGGAATAAIDIGIAEVLMWNRVLTDAERVTVRSALASHYPVIGA